MFTEMQAALATSQHTLDEEKGLIGKCKLVGAALAGAVALPIAILLYSTLVATDLGQCEAVTDGKCLVYQVGDGNCDWSCNVPECEDDRGDCKYYTDSCQDAWLMQNAQTSRSEYKSAGLITSCFMKDTDGVPLSFPLNDTRCDRRCDFEACGFDGGDCLASSLGKSPQCADGCYSHFLGDNVCQPQCNNAGCLFDLRDCVDASQQWRSSVARNAQSPLSRRPLEHLMCNRAPAGTGALCGFNFEGQAVDDALELRDIIWRHIETYRDSGLSPCQYPSWALPEALWNSSECRGVSPGKCPKGQVPGTLTPDIQLQVDKASAAWKGVCEHMGPSIAHKVLIQHATTSITSLVYSSTHAHTCREHCNTAACGYDGGVCFAQAQSWNYSSASGWCAPGCSPQMQNDQTCDAECFTEACNYDAPSCDFCSIFVDEEDGVYATAITAIKAQSATSQDRPTDLLVPVAAVVGILVLVHRIWMSMLASLNGFFDPLGKVLAKPWDKSDNDDIVAVGPSTRQSKSRLVFFTAPIWPLARATPLHEDIGADWTDLPEPSEYTEELEQAYRSKAIKYASEDGQPLRLELHQSSTAAMATMLIMACLFACPAVAVIAAAHPGLPEDNSFARISMGNLFHPESACRYDTSPHNLLRNRLQDMHEPTCGALTWPVYAVLMTDVVVCLCILAMAGSRSRELTQLRKATPRLSDYSIHISGLGRSNSKDSTVQEIVRKIGWIRDEDHAEDITVYPIWQDDLHWGWAKLQTARLAAAGKEGSAEYVALNTLVKKLNDSRHVMGLPRPFSGHCICIFNKQHKQRACLHHHKQSILRKAAIRLLDFLKGENAGKRDTAPKEPKAKLRRAGEYSDIDWTSLRHGGGGGCCDQWRGWSVSLGALLTIIGARTSL
jgi:hypothetical protein